MYQPYGQITVIIDLLITNLQSSNPTNTLDYLQLICFFTFTVTSLLLFYL